MEEGPFPVPCSGGSSAVPAATDPRTHGCSSLCSCSTYVLGGRPRGGGDCQWHGGGWQVTCKHMRSPVRLHPAYSPHRALHSHTGPDSPAWLILWSELPEPPCPSPSSKDRVSPRAEEMQQCSHSPSTMGSAHPSPTSAAEQSSAGTVGTGIEPQTERASAAFQGTLLPAHAGVGPAQLCAAPAAAPGCVVCAGETIKLQQAESKDKMSVKRYHHKRAEISDCQREMGNGDGHRLNGALWIPEIKGRLSLLQPPCISIPRSKSHYGR